MSWEWFGEYGIVILFYLAVIALIYFNRKKFDFEGKVIALYRTKIGLKLMDKIGRKHEKFIIGLSTVGVWIGFLGMLFMVCFMIFGLYLLVFEPAADPLFSPVLPGIQIPGSPIKLPLIEGLIALFIVVAIHEFSHGVVARAFKIKVKNSGFVMFGPLPGAFVEPEEKQLQKKPKKTQLAVFAAGPWSNILLSLLLLIVLFLTSTLSVSTYAPDGVVITGFSDGMDIMQGGRLAMLQKGEIITAVDSFNVSGRNDLALALENKTPGESIHLKTNLGDKDVVLGRSEEDNSTPVLGITVNHIVVPRNGNEYSFAGIAKGVYFWFFGNPYDLDFMKRLGLIGLVYVLSLGIGIVNLLPIGPTDGGRMYLIALQKLFKKKESAMKLWSKTASILIIMLIILVVVPILRAIL